MGEAYNAARVVLAPTMVFANVYDREYSAMDDNLASIKLVAIFKKDGNKLGYDKIEVSDGALDKPMEEAYETARAPVYAAAHQAAYDASIGEGKGEEGAEAAARAAGNDAVIAAGIVRADPQEVWDQVKVLVAANETAANLLKLLDSEDWGKLMLDAAWRRAAAR